MIGVDILLNDDPKYKNEDVERQILKTSNYYSASVEMLKLLFGPMRVLGVVLSLLSSGRLVVAGSTLLHVLHDLAQWTLIQGLMSQWP